MKASISEKGTKSELRSKPWGVRQRRCPSDPAAQWIGAHKGPHFFAYSDNYLIDLKFGVIVDVEASRSVRQAEVRTMINRTEQRRLKPERLGLWCRALECIRRGQAQGWTPRPHSLLNTPVPALRFRVPPMAPAPTGKASCNFP